jgi:hypothetical protein
MQPRDIIRKLSAIIWMMWLRSIAMICDPNTWRDGCSSTCQRQRWHIRLAVHLPAPTTRWCGWSKPGCNPTPPRPPTRPMAQALVLAPQAGGRCDCFFWGGVEWCDTARKQIKTHCILPCTYFHAHDAQGGARHHAQSSYDAGKHCHGH